MSSKYSSVIWLMALLALAFCGLPDNSVIVNNIYVILGTVSYVFCLYNWLKSGNKIISIYAIFVLYMMMSHLGQSLLSLIAVPEELLDIYNRFQLDALTKYHRYQMLCAAALNVGTVYALSKSGNVLPYKECVEACKNNQSGWKNDFFLDALLFLSLAYSAYKAVSFIILRQTVDYAEFFEQRSGGNMIFSIIRYLSLLLGLRYVYINRYRNFVYGIWTFLILAYMIGGSRGTAISYVACMALTLPITMPSLFIKRRMVYWLVGGIFVFSLLSVISANRSSVLSSGSLSSGEGLAVNVYSTMSEMGGSAKTVVYSMQAIERNDIPHYQTNLYFLLAIPLPASVVKSLGLSDVQLAGWVTDYAGSYWSGLGYSCIAESFVNYGWFGWLWFILYGFFITYAECYIHRRWAKRDMFVPGLLAIYLAVQIFYARAEIYHSQGTARFCFYIYLIYKLFVSSRSYKRTA